MLQVILDPFKLAAIAKYIDEKYIINQNALNVLSCYRFFLEVSETSKGVYAGLCFGVNSLNGICGF